MADLRIQVLGDLSVELNGLRVSLPSSRKTRALLAYLAVTGRPQRRERLCELFWEVPDDPRGALRWSLSKLRAALNSDGPDLIDANRSSVQLVAGGYALDSVELTEAAGEGFDRLTTERLESLAALVRGPFLDDLALPNCPVFEAWRVAMAEQFDLAARRLLETLAKRLSDEPDRARPYLHALRLLSSDDAHAASEVVAISGAAAKNPTGSASSSAVAPSPSPRVSYDVRYCTGRDGTRLAYSIGGKGPLLVRAGHWLSHIQFDGETPIWRHWIDALHERFTFLRYDERGNGLSDWTVRDVSFEAMLSDLESVVEASGFPKFSLLGISQGAAFSIAYAVRHPERVERLILYGGFARGARKRGNPQELVLRDALETLLRDGWGGDNPVFRNMFVHRFIPRATTEHLTAMAELQRKTMPAANALALSQMASMIDVSDLLPLVRVPTLVLHAREDRIAPFEAGLDLAARIPGARFVPLESDNHILLQDDDAFAHFLEAVDAFCAEDR